MSQLPAEITDLGNLEVLLLHENEALQIPDELLGDKNEFTFPITFPIKFSSSKNAQKNLAYLRETGQGPHPTGYMQLVDSSNFDYP